MSKWWKNLIAPVLVVLVAFVSLQVVSSKKALAAKDVLFKACVEQGMDVTWTAETHYFIFTDVTLDCVKP